MFNVSGQRNPDHSANGHMFFGKNWKNLEEYFCLGNRVRRISIPFKFLCLNPSSSAFWTDGVGIYANREENARIVNSIEFLMR